MTCADDGVLQTYLTHRPQLHALATRITGCRWKGEEIVQDAYFRVTAEARTECPTVQRPFQYLWSMVYRLAIDAHRGAAREPAAMGSGVPSGQAGNDSSPQHLADALVDPVTPERNAADREQLIQVLQVLHKLPPRTRQAFELNQIQGHTQKDVAKMLGVSCPRINAMIRTAARALNDAFDEDM